MLPKKKRDKKIEKITDLLVELVMIILCLRRGLNVRRVILNVLGSRHCSDER